MSSVLLLLGLLLTIVFYLFFIFQVDGIWHHPPWTPSHLPRRINVFFTMIFFIFQVVKPRMGFVVNVLGRLPTSLVLFLLSVPFGGQLKVAIKFFFCYSFLFFFKLKIITKFLIYLFMLIVEFHLSLSLSLARARTLTFSFFGWYYDTMYMCMTLCICV